MKTTLRLLALLAVSLALALSARAQGFSPIYQASLSGATYLNGNMTGSGSLTLASTASFGGLITANGNLLTSNVLSYPSTGTDVPGTDLSLKSGIGTGAGASSSLRFWAPSPGSTGSTAQTLTQIGQMNTSGVTFSVPLTVTGITDSALSTAGFVTNNGSGLLGTTNSIPIASLSGPFALLNAVQTFTSAQTISLASGIPLTLSTSGTALTLNGNEGILGTFSVSSTGSFGGNLTVTGTRSTMAGFFNTGAIYLGTNVGVVQFNPISGNNSFAINSGTSPYLPVTAYYGTAASNLPVIGWQADAIEDFEIVGYNGGATFSDSSTAQSGSVAIRYLWSPAATAPTLAATNSSVTYTIASTEYIAGAPSAGTNVTITNPYALYVAAGAVRFGGAMTSSGSVAFPGIASTGAVEFVGMSNSTSGNVVQLTTAAAATLLGISSRTVKHDITDFSGGLDIVDRINVRRFFYNADSGLGYDPTRPYYGPIAEELALVFPDAVDTTPGHPPSINDRIVLNIAVNSIKELHTYTNRLVATACILGLLVLLLTGHGVHLHRKLSRLAVK